jgi:peptide/nickel transport system substrate-binding protein
MRSRKRWSSVLGVAALVTALAVVAAGCGSSSKKTSSTSTSSSGSSSGKTFDTLHVVWGDTDYMDPGLSYRLESWQLFQNIYEGLVTQKHAAGAASADIVPAIATSMPTVSSDAKDYKFTLRKGLKYSNGKPVKARISRRPSSATST